jgi:hypothetical protein
VSDWSAGSGAISVIGISATFCPTNAAVGTGITCGVGATGGGAGDGCCAPAEQLIDNNARTNNGIGFTAGK